MKAVLLVSAILCAVFAIVPYPASFDMGGGALILNSPLKMVANISSSDILNKAIDRYNTIIFGYPSNGGSNPFGQLNILVGNDHEDLQFGLGMLETT